MTSIDSSAGSADDGVTKRAILMCAGLCDRPRRHELSRYVTVDGPHEHYFILIFRCAGCGDERVWGNEEAVQ